MRLTDHQAAEIVKLARQIAGVPVDVRVFGSRLNDHAKGGDLDLMIELTEPQTNPALLAARLSAKVSRLMDGRKVDVLLSAPNLMRLPIHEIALREGRKL
jgi:predicted nucleotidyltransferase